ncbi:unnamed protein product [Cylindrotheca closterium]|uniref:subtilisin n=1 Tax=Cylindrotheca closterium TaxID=2856 RepID=A0AAD2JIN1_9STRA|nr:unnamed protein product [Cylindrotheca closterium]
MIIRQILLLQILLLLGLVSQLIQAAEEESEQAEEEYVRVLVGFHDRDQEKEYVRRQRVRPRTGKPQAKVNYEFQKTEAVAMQVTRRELEEMKKDSKQFSYVEEDILVPVAAAWAGGAGSNPSNATTLDEEAQRRLIELRNYGIELTQAHRTIDPDPDWDQECGVYLCVVDSGVFLNNADIPYSRGDGYVEGKAFGDAEGDQWFNPRGTDHGTQVAGIMIARGGNDRGVRGVIPHGPQRSNVCLKVAKVVPDGEGVALISSLLQASEWCAEAAGDKPLVINLSFAVEFETAPEKAIYQRLYDQGVLIVAAAGNLGGTDYMYPASHDSVMSVASINAASRRSSFSQRNDQVEIAAPGELIETLQAESNNLLMASGTSLASPFVAGLAARIWSAAPRCSNVDIRQALRDTARELGDGVPNRNFGYGLIRARDAKDLLVTSGCNSKAPTKSPTRAPTSLPSASPSAMPSGNPTVRCMDHLESCASHDECCDGFICTRMTENLDDSLVCRREGTMETRPRLASLDGNKCRGGYAAGCK